MSEFSSPEQPKLSFSEKIKSKIKFLIDSFSAKGQEKRYKEKNMAKIQNALLDKDPDAAKHIQEEFEKKAKNMGQTKATKAWLTLLGITTATGAITWTVLAEKALKKKYFPT